MEQDTYDHWQEQLQGYVMIHTGLPLYDLDAVEVPLKEPARFRMLPSLLKKSK
jgi:hypothetical protein